jgi:hypothetical protein
MPRTALIRVKEWSAWVPERPDPNNPDETLMDGTVGLEILEGERILEVNITNTGLKIEGITEESKLEEGEGVKHSFCIFQALIAGVLPDKSELNPADTRTIDPADYISPQPGHEKSIEVIEEVKKDMRARAAAQDAQAMIAAGIKPEQARGGPPHRGRAKR